MNDEWAEILEDYNHAKAALEPADAQNGPPDKDTGLYFMWKAYCRANKAAEPKDHLLLGRIFALVADQFSKWNYDRYRKYVKPAVTAYDLAIQAGQQPTEEELRKIHEDEGFHLYRRKYWDVPDEEQWKQIKGYEQLDESGFWFLDSVIVRFEHAQDTARLTLRYHEVTVTFLFEGIVTLSAGCESYMNWVSEFSCYPCYGHEELLEFFAGFIRLTCSSISVESVEINDDYEDDEDENEESDEDDE